MGIIYYLYGILYKSQKNKFIFILRFIYDIYWEAQTRCKLHSKKFLMEQNNICQNWNFVLE